MFKCPILKEKRFVENFDPEIKAGYLKRRFLTFFAIQF